MTKTYCDRCGKEAKDYSDIYLPLRRKGRKRPYVIIKHYELCDECIKKLHEFIE
jgi:NMD protein affecting ribosome stability and mRNA decay